MGAGSAFYMSGSSLKLIFNFIISIGVMFLQMGQNSGNLRRIVSS